MKLKLELSFEESGLNDDVLLKERLEPCVDFEAKEVFSPSGLNAEILQLSPRNKESFCPTTPISGDACPLERSPLTEFKISAMN